MSTKIYVAGLDYAEHPPQHTRNGDLEMITYPRGGTTLICNPGESPTSRIERHLKTEAEPQELAL